MFITLKINVFYQIFYTSPFTFLRSSLLSHTFILFTNSSFHKASFFINVIPFWNSFLQPVLSSSSTHSLKHCLVPFFLLIWMTFIFNIIIIHFFVHAANWKNFGVEIFFRGLIKDENWTHKIFSTTYY